MSKDTCSYHQTRPAVWDCEECARCYCGQCVLVTDADPAGLPRCPLCARPLDYLGAGNAAQPFWSVAHRFFAFPLKGSGVAFLLTMALLIFFAVFVPLGLLALLVLLFTVAIGVKYCFAVLEAVAMGADGPPSLSDAVAGDEDHLFFKLVAMLIAVGFVQAVADVLIHPAVGMLVALLWTLVMPAAIMLLAINKKLGQALSPGPIAALVFTIGWPYLLAVFLTNVISTGPYVATMFFAESLLTSPLSVPLLTAITAYFAVVNFAMLGYLIYEHQGDLGYVAGDPDDERLPDTLENRRRQLLGEVNVLMKESRQEDALARFHERRGGFAEDMAFHQRHFELASQCGDPDATARAADPYLELLMTRDGVDQALDVWRTAARVDARYRPGNPAIAHTLAEQAYGRNLTKEALSLLVNLHKRAPEYAEIGAAYELAAKLLREQGDEVQAGKLETFVQAFLARRSQPPSGNLTLASLE